MLSRKRSSAVVDPIASDSEVAVLPTSYQGKHAEAESHSERCQKIKETALGPEHPSLAISLSIRAGLLGAQVRACRFFHDSPYSAVNASVVNNRTGVLR